MKKEGKWEITWRMERDEKREEVSEVGNKDDSMIADNKHHRMM